MEKRYKFSDRIRQYRRDHNLTLEDMGRLVGVSAQAISKWENDEYSPKMDKFESIADKLGVSILWLFGFEGPVSESELLPTVKDAARMARDKEAAPKIEISGKQYSKLTPEQLELKMKTTLKAMELLENKIIDKQTFDKIVDD